jgi:hypothetical protein
MECRPEDVDASRFYYYDFDGTTETCFVEHVGWGITTPNWMQLGGDLNELDYAFRAEEDVAINGILSEVWNRQIPNGVRPDHITYWDRANNAPVRRHGDTGGLFDSVQDFSDFQPDTEIDPTVSRPPPFCLTQPVHYTDVECRDGLDPSTPFLEVIGLCPDDILPGLLQPDERSSAEAPTKSAGAGTAGVVGGSFIAGVVFVGIGLVVARRTRERSGNALHSAQSLDSESQSVQSFEMGGSSSTATV